MLNLALILEDLSDNNMEQIKNKTYTAPDGSVFRVEADGSVTKIKSGHVQSNESPSKYKITPDGKIYRIEADGSVTYLGNAEERGHLKTSHSSNRPKPKRKGQVLKWICIIHVLLGVGIALVLIHIAISNMSDFESPRQDLIEAEDTTFWNGETQEDLSYEQTEQPGYNVPAAPEKYYFPELTIFYGHEGDPEDGENVKMFFFTDGTCKIYEDNICESSECGGNYYVEDDVIHVTWYDDTSETFDISNGYFSRYGIIVSRIYE